MAKNNLQKCLEVLWPFEGGYVDHPKDPGGATNMGITFATLKRWRGTAITKADVRNLTKAEAAAIYEANYWRPIRGDDLPLGVDLSTMDYGVNSGTSRSVKDLQRVLGVKADGVVGDIETLPALRKAAPRATIKAHCARRLSFVQGLKIWDTFGKGWSRRIATVEAAALGWVSTKAQLEADAKAARDKAVGQAGGAVVGVGGGTAVPDMTGFPWWVVVAVAAVVVVPLVIRAVINSDRAKAIAEVAKEA